MQNESIITFTFYLISLVLLVTHLKTSEKDYFLLSVIFIIFGSINYHIFVFRDLRSILFPLAILFSFVGDLFMANKIKIVESRIINGIIGFGTAHILYIFAFYNVSREGFHLLQLPIGIFLWIVIYRIAVYTPTLPKSLLVGTLIYSAILVILLMVISNIVVNNEFGGLVTFITLFGILLFILSDSIIAYTEFKGSIPYSSQIIAITYILSQILLQLSVLFIEV